MTEREQVEQAIAALESQRAILGDAVVETALRSLHEKLAALSPAPPVEEQRKQATILFADLAGFTAMSEQMDPEEVRAITSRYFHHITPPIRQYGGSIEKYIGDAVMAVFGIPTAQEQDVEHAIRAALEMQEALRQLNDEMGAIWGFRLRMRVGINTGLVLVGYLGDDFTVVGDAVNLASRLESAAPVGGVLISHHAYRHVRGIFDALALEPIIVKGKAEPIPIYLVEGVKARAFQVLTRGVEGIETRTIGREAELQQMQDAWRVVLRERRMQALLISADAGLGKSRLLYEFHNWMELRPSLEDWVHFPVQRFWLFQGRAHHETSKVPYALMRDLFSFRFEIQESDPPTVARAKLEQGMLRFMGVAMEEEEVLMRSHFLGHLIGFDFSDSPHLRGILHDTKQIRDRAFHYATQFFALTSQPRPVAVYLEDIHWADGGSLDLLAHLLRTCRESPILIVCLARPTLAEHWPSWVEEKLFQHYLPLAPLTREGAERLVNEILRKMGEIPQALSELIVGRAEGNPFYVEELIKMLIEEGVILTELDPWQVEPLRLLTTHVPPTLTGVLQARLDSLPLHEKLVLQWASVVGRIFWEEAVAHLGQGSITDAELDKILNTLCKREIVFPQSGSAFVGTREYIFKHALLHEVTYESVLKQQRLLYHAQVARWLLRKGGSRAVEYAGLIASHFERAEEKESAAEWYKRAGYQAQASHANQGAAEYFERALTLLPDGAQGKVQFDLGSVLEVMGRWEEAEASYRQALSLAEEKSDERAQAQCRHALGRLFHKRGDYQEALLWQTRAQATCQARNDLEGVGQAMSEIGEIQRQLGNYTEAQAILEQALTYLERANNWGEMANALHHLGLVAWSQGDYSLAQRQLEKSLALHQALGNKAAVARGLSNLGGLAYVQGDQETALALTEQSLALRRELGDKSGIGASLGNLGVLHYQRKEYPAARILYEEGLAIKKELGDKRGIAMGLSNLALIAYEEGAHESARALFCRSLQISQEIGDRREICGCLVGLARLANDVERAVRLVAAAHALAEIIGAVFWPAYQRLVEQTLADARAQVAEHFFAVAWSEGQAMTLDESIAYALGSTLE